MILRELFVPSADKTAISTDLQYSPDQDSSVMSRSDTRKTRLTLGQINRLRKAAEEHILEQEHELKFLQQMYMNSAAPPA
jgi:hypothetical protein